MRVTFHLDHIAYRLPKGHRLRIAISSSYWPLLWPAPEAATITLFGGTLNLPVRRTAKRAEHVFAPPVSARATCHWTEELERGDIRLRTETCCEMWSDLKNFHLTARIEAFENDR